MPIFAGPNSPSPGTDFEARSDRIGFPVRSSDPSPASAGDVYFNSSENRLKVYNGTSWNEISGGSTGIVATGGTIATPGNGYRYHLFTSPGTFAVTSIGPSPLSQQFINALLVGGGGGGAPGSTRGGGGGAGAFMVQGLIPVTASYSVPVTIGGGGVTSGDDPISSPTQGSGTPTSFGPSYVAAGGGRGGGNAGNGRPAASISPGNGSGGGGAGNNGSTAAGTGGLFGNPGGGGIDSGQQSGGGGGGAGTSGGGGSPSGGGNGGAGSSFALIPTDYGVNGFFAAGGGGWN